MTNTLLKAIEMNKIFHEELYSRKGGIVGIDNRVGQIQMTTEGFVENVVDENNFEIMVDSHKLGDGTDFFQISCRIRNDCVIYTLLKGEEREVFNEFGIMGLVEYHEIGGV